MPRVARYAATWVIDVSTADSPPVTVVGMTTTSEALTSPADDHDFVLRLAASAYWVATPAPPGPHTGSDLRLLFAWRADQHLTLLPPSVGGHPTRCVVTLGGL